MPKTLWSAVVWSKMPFQDDCGRSIQSFNRCEVEAFVEQYEPVYGTTARIRSRLVSKSKARRLRTLWRYKQRIEHNSATSEPKKEEPAP